MNEPASNSSGLHNTLPDFRNRDTIARVIVVMNIALVVIATLYAAHARELVPVALDLAVVLEPALLMSLIALYAANAPLRRLSYSIGVAACTAIAVVATEIAIGIVLATGVDYPLYRNARAVLFAVLVVLLLAEYFRLRNRALSPAIVEARLQALQARIRPHFLFNSMNAMLSIIRTDPRRAEQAIEDLAELFRTLMSDNSKLTTLGREIELVRDYLRIEQLRLGERLIVEWNIEGSPEIAQVPPLFLQPLVENAVYHGVESSRNPGRVEIDVRRSGERVMLRLTNPYQPEHQGRQGNRMALANIRERLALHFGTEARLVAAPVGDRYRIDIELPYRP